MANVPIISNVSLFTDFLTQMLQYFNGNTVASALTSMANVTAPSTVISNINSPNATSGNLISPATHTGNVDNTGTSMVNVAKTNTPTVNLAAAWAGNSGVTATSSIASMTDL